jgi:hypothetical protein
VLLRQGEKLCFLFRADLDHVSAHPTAVNIRPATTGLPPDEAVAGAAPRQLGAEPRRAHMRVPTDKEGPFKKCAYDGRKPPPPKKIVLPHVVPEAGIFD